MTGLFCACNFPGQPFRTVGCELVTTVCVCVCVYCTAIIAPSRLLLLEYVTWPFLYSPLCKHLFHTAVILIVTTIFLFSSGYKGKVRLHRYICLWGASERKLGKSLKPKLLWGVTRMAYSPSLWLMAIGWWNKNNQCRKLTKSDTNLRSLYESWFRNALISKSVILWWQARKEKIQSSKEQTHKHTQSLKHSFKKVSVSHAQLAHFSTLAKEKHMLLILNFSTLTFITIARTTMPFARLHSQMVCTQSEPAEIPQHIFVHIAPCTSRRG